MERHLMHRSSVLVSASCKTLIGMVSVCLVAVLGLPNLVAAQTAANVAVVINTASPASQRIGEYYAKKRGLPAANVLRIKTSTDETIPRAGYEATIEAPLAGALARARLQDRILYIVLTKGVPLRIAGTEGLDGTVSSVDSELTLLYRKMVGQSIATRGRINNPYYLGAKEPSAAQPFTRRDYDIYLVTRLDAFTVDEAIALIDKASAPSLEGKIVLDQQDKLINRQGEDWLANAAVRLKAAGLGDRVQLDTTVEGVRNVKPVIGYYSWGSNDPRNRVRSAGMGFVPGSIAATFVSTDGRTFIEPPREWIPSEATDKKQQYAGTAQSLIGDLIRDGATGVAGHVAEPFLQSTIRPDVLFPAYMAGFNLAEAFYLGMPHLSWQTVVIGDPLCAPFRRTGPRAEQESRLDPATDLPEIFSGRRMKLVQAMNPGVPERALALGFKAEGLMLRGDAAAARPLLEQSAQVAPNYAWPQLQLAVQHDLAGQADQAIERYRRVLAVDPRNPTALNNLAYSLAVNKNNPKEALPIARQALAVSPQNGTVLDTLAWVEYLSGDVTTAAKRIPLAVQSEPGSPDIRLHAATIYAAAGARAVAQDELAAALKLKPALEKSPEVAQVREKLEKMAAN
jgi:uncharacterized protein (TIGR03790 family)